MLTTTYELVFPDFKFLASDVQGSKTVHAVHHELMSGAYDINGLTFNKDDIIIDIGANIGLVSIYLAKKFPHTQIYAFEPFTENYQNLQNNTKKIKNIKTFNLAVTKDGRIFDMICCLTDNSGGGTGHLSNMGLPGHQTCSIPSITLDQIFKQNNIEKCKYLKIDCEGTEHEILLNTTSLNKVEYLAGEFHINTKLEREGHSLQRTHEHCLKYIDKDKIKIVNIRMAE